LWTNVCDLDAAAVGRSVLVRAATQAIREVGNKMVFLVLRQSMTTVQ
jgi:aspartyl-tRNA synthetase